MPKKKRTQRAITKLVKYFADNPAVVTALLQVLHASICFHMIAAGFEAPVGRFILT